VHCALQRPTATAAIPEKNLLVVGSPGHIAVFDLTTNLRQSLTAIPNGHTPKLLQVAPSKASVFVACSEWTVYIHSLKSSRPVCLISLIGVKKGPLANPIMAFMSASQSPALFVTDMLKESVRVAYTKLPAGESKSKLSKELSPGFKLNLEKGKGAVALTAHPYAPVLMVLTSNGELQLYSHRFGGAVLEPIVQFTSAPSAPRLLPSRAQKDWRRDRE
jgi:hypothetical protein